MHLIHGVHSESHGYDCCIAVQEWPHLWAALRALVLRAIHQDGVSRAWLSHALDVSYVRTNTPGTYRALVGAAPALNQPASSS
jgi:hypothetical protein